MRCLPKFICMYSILVFVTVTAASQTAAPVTAIKACRLIDPETSTVTTNQTILIEDESIKAVGANLATAHSVLLIGDPVAYAPRLYAIACFAGRSNYLSQSSPARCSRNETSSKPVFTY